MLHELAEREAALMNGHRFGAKVEGGWRRNINENDDEKGIFVEFSVNIHLKDHKRSFFSAMQLSSGVVHT